MAAGGVDGFLGGHVVLTAGEAEIRDGLVGPEGRWGAGGGHLESWREPVFFRKPLSSSNKHINKYTHTDCNGCICMCSMQICNASGLLLILKSNAIQSSHIVLLLDTVARWICLTQLTDLFKLREDAPQPISKCSQAALPFPHSQPCFKETLTFSLQPYWLQSKVFFTEFLSTVDRC